MSDPTDERVLARQASPPLLSRPQPLGFLPSFWFWNRASNWQHVRWGAAALAVVTVLSASLLQLGHPVLNFAFGSGVITLALGLFERWLRGKAARGERLGGGPEREALVESGEVGAGPPGDG